MDKTEAKTILQSELEKYRQRIAFAPLTDDFILSPSGEFLDEF